MFVLHTSNRTENLLSHLSQVIESQPLRSPFDKELFLIQSQGMERWLSQQLASRFGVWGNYQFYFPGNFFSEISEKFAHISMRSHYQREQMVWIVERLLREIEADNSDYFQILIDYINGENSSVRRFQLAQQLARIFDQYQIMRPDWLRAWSKGVLIGLGDAEQWQMMLWQRIEKRYGDCHRGEVWERAIAAIEKLSAKELSTRLPQRLSIFGLNTIPPLLLHLLRGLSQHTDIHLYLLTPTEEYWGEGGSRNSMIEQLVTSDDNSAANDHRLLLSLGEQAREFRGLLLNQLEFSHEFASYQPNDEKKRSILGRLQNDILSNNSNPIRLESDDSIAIHSCHSRLREVEVLHDLMLDTLNQNRDLELRDIVVMSPDIQNYAAHIKTVFHDIPHAIADRTLKEDSEILDNMIQFMKLSRGRFGWQEVFDLLSKPAIFPAFGLTESDLELIRHWINRVNIRWGISGKHRTELGLPEFDAFSWESGLNRLMMGYLMGESDEMVDGIFPYSDIEGSSAQALGALFRFIEILSQAHKELTQGAAMADWGDRLSKYATLIFDQQRAQESGLEDLNALIDQLSEELADIHRGNIDIEVIEQWMQNQLSERKSSNGFLRGELTFCSMLPMRTIPFKTIVLLGMNEGDYPRVIQPFTFDLMASDHRAGDRSARNDDRAQFLETLISAQERLIITYVGQSIQDNSTIAPSAVVGELIDLLEVNYQQKNIVTRHPLQPFNRIYYDTSSKLFSYSESHKQTAELLAANRQNLTQAATWWKGAIDKEIGMTIELDALFSFFKKPQAYFLKESLGIKINEMEDDPLERELFSLDSLDSYITNQQLVELMMEGDGRQEYRQIIESGWWVGPAGEIELERQIEAIAPFIESIRELNIGNQIEPINIDIKVGRYRIVGQLNNNYEQGALLYRYSRFKGGDLINGWLYHQIINRVQPATTSIIACDRKIQMRPEMVVQADLEKWLDIYYAGQTEPSELFVEAALAYLNQTLNTRAKLSPLDAAKRALEKQFDDGYSSELLLLYRGKDEIEALISESFEEICQELLLPLWGVLE